MIETPSYYGIIPANVRYDKDLSPNTKLFYSELTCLSTKDGYCYASNNYFAELYGVVPSSISNWVKQLVAKNYISVEYIYEGKECKERRIYITDNNKGIQKNDKVFKNLEKGIQKFGGGYSKKTKDNITSNSITSNNNNIYIPETTKDPQSVQINNKSIDSKRKPVKHKHGEFNNVLLSDKEFDKLKAEQGEETAKEVIQFFSELKEMKGYKYNSDYLALKKWGIKAYWENKTSPPINRKTNLSNNFDKKTLDNKIGLEETEWTE